MWSRRTIQVSWLLVLCGVLPAACGDAFSAAPDGASGNAGHAGGPSNEAGVGGAGTETDPTLGGDTSVPAGGAVGDAECRETEDCPAPASSCEQVTCVDGSCSKSVLSADTPCDGGTCDDAGQCVASTCDSGEKDGDETGKDCGGSCGLCPDGQGCATAADCLSGVCGDDVCKASACTDKVKNGDETDVDCGGSCALKCPQAQGCKVTADCAVAAGDGAESVRCVQQQCVSTKPPSQGGGPFYWQDFAAERVVKSPRRLPGPRRRVLSRQERQLPNVCRHHGGREQASEQGADFHP